jgi:hypothetical protein
VRIAAETSLSPGWLLVAFPAVLYPAYLALEALFGRGLAAATDFGGDFEARLLPMWATGLGYISMMGTYLARGTFRDLEALRPILRGGADTYGELRQELTQFDRRRLWIGGFLGFLLVCVLGELTVGFWTQRVLIGDWQLRDPCVAALLFALWITAGTGAVYLIDSARVYSRIGEQHVEIDLLNLAPLSPLNHHGLRIVLFIVIITAAGVIVFTPGAPDSQMIGAFAGSFCYLVVAVAAFLLPVRGLRRQIRARKAEELARVREDIRHNRELASESAEAGARLPGLLAYMEKIESVREWPFDAPTLTRFFLYVAIPLGSWLGGALVERLLGAALD